MTNSFTLSPGALILLRDFLNNTYQNKEATEQSDAWQNHLTDLGLGEETGDDNLSREEEDELLSSRESALTKALSELNKVVGSEATLV